MRTFGWSPLLWFLSSPAAWSQSTALPRAEAGSSYGGGAWLGLVTLALLIGLVALVLWFYRTYHARQTTGPVQILAAQSLGPRDRILIVRIEDRILALGQTATQINLLTELDSFIEPAAQASSAPSVFAGVLNKLTQRPLP